MLHQYFNTPRMAGGTRSYEMGRRLVAKGHEVVLITTDRATAHGGWRVTSESGIEVHWLPVPYSNRTGYWMRIWAFVKFAVLGSIRASRTKADIVFATSTPLTIAIPGMLAAWVQRVPFVFEVRDLWPKVPIEMGLLRSPILRHASLWLERTAYRRAAGIVALSPGMAAHVRSIAGDGKPTTVIPNGCDIHLFDSIGPERDILRKENPWLGGRPLVVYAGTLGYVNDPVYAADLAAEVAHLDGEVRFAILGTGREEKALRHRAGELGVLDATLFLLGETDKHTAARWLIAADVAMSLIRDDPLFWENATTNKVFDALAAGKPVITNHPGWQVGVVLDADAGIVLDAHDAGQAACELVRLLHNRDRMRAMAHAGRVLAESRFARDAQADEFESFLAELATVA